MILAAVEGVLRLAWGPPPPPVQVYSGLAPVDRYFEARGDTVEAVFQLRQPIAPFPVAPTGTRVAALGGSSVHGGTPGLTADEEFPALLSGTLGVEVLNLGNPGLDSHDVSAIAVEVVREFGVDVLVVYTGHNDFGNAWFLDRYGEAAGGLRARVQAALEHLQLYAQLRRGVISSGVPRDDRVLGEHDLPEKPALSAARRWAALRYLESNLERIAWLTAGADVPLVLVTPASSLGVPPIGRRCSGTPCAADLFQEARAVGADDPERAHALRVWARDVDPIPLRAPTAALEVVRGVAARHDHVILVDAAAELGTRPVFFDPVHLNAAGHRAVADLIAPAVAAVLD